MQRTEEDDPVHDAGLDGKAFRPRLDEGHAGRRRRLAVLRRLDRVGLDREHSRPGLGEVAGVLARSAADVDER